MNDKTYEALLMFLGAGGGLVAIVTAILSYRRDASNMKKVDIDDRIAAWKAISEKSEKSMKDLEVKLENALKEIEELRGIIAQLTLILAKEGIEFPQIARKIEPP